MSKKQPAAAPAHPPAHAPVPEPAPPASEKRSFQGKYKLAKNDNYETYLTNIGLGWVSRMMALHASTDLTISQDEEKFTIKQDGREIKFTVGEDFEDKQNGHVMKVTPHWDGEKLVMSLEPKVEGKGKAEKQIRELNEEELILTLELGDFKAVRTFKKVPEAK